MTPVSPPVPRQGYLNDFHNLEPHLVTAAQATGLPYEVLVAHTLQESSWHCEAYRYEPGYDRRYVSSLKGRETWEHDGAWRLDGPTAAEWFAAHPTRAKERSPDKPWDFTAQTRIAASYGPYQLMYPTAVGLGYHGDPEGLYHPESVALGAKLLELGYRWGKTRGMSHDDALAVALARYNGGGLGNDDPRHLRNAEYVRAIDRRFRQCWGRPMFAVSA
jgi:hypothetical protein